MFTNVLYKFKIRNVLRGLYIENEMSYMIQSFIYLSHIDRLLYQLDLLHLKHTQMSSFNLTFHLTYFIQ